MAYEQKPNSGSLFINDRKQGANHPDLNGSLKVEQACQSCGAVHISDFWLSAWQKNGAKGDFYSLSVKPKEQRGAAPGASPALGAPKPMLSQRPAATVNDLDDEIPF